MTKSIPLYAFGHFHSSVGISSRMRSGKKVRTRRLSWRCEDQGGRAGVDQSASGSRASSPRADTGPCGISQRLRRRGRDEGHCRRRRPTHSRRDACRELDRRCVLMACFLVLPPGRPSLSQVTAAICDHIPNAARMLLTCSQCMTGLSGSNNRDAAESVHSENSR